MSAEAKFMLEVISPGNGPVLDLGGGRGTLRYPLEELGYQYMNLDIRRFENGEPSVIGDSHALPFSDSSLDIVVSKDTLEHFVRPWAVVNEVHRVLKSDGQFAIWVPFMHPFHGNDFYRYTPLGLRHLLKDFEILHFDSPLWVFTVFASAATEILKRMHFCFLEWPVKRICGWMDTLLMRRRKGPTSFAAAYRILVRKP
jgi:ubiquinone/menaquinone biosynthesis C-methylase UbiE